MHPTVPIIFLLHAQSVITQWLKIMIYYYYLWFRGLMGLSWTLSAGVYHVVTVVDTVT